MRTGIPERLCGRPFSLNDLQAIKEEVQGGYSLSGMEIARRVCGRLNWGNSLGQPQLMTGKVFDSLGLGRLRSHRLFRSGMESGCSRSVDRLGCVDP